MPGRAPPTLDDLYGAPAPAPVFQGRVGAFDPFAGVVGAAPTPGEPARAPGPSSRAAPQLPGSESIEQGPRRGPQRAGGRGADELPTGRRDQAPGGGAGSPAAQAAMQQEASARLAAQVEQARKQFDEQRAQQARAAAAAPSAAPSRPTPAAASAGAPGAQSMNSTNAVGGAVMAQRAAQTMPAGQVLDPRGLYNPAAGQPGFAGNIGAQTIAGTVGVGQITGQVPAGVVGQPGVVGGQVAGVVPPGVYGPTTSVAAPSLAPEQQWLNRMQLSADGWLDLAPRDRASCLRRGGCADNLVDGVATAVDAFSAARTRRAAYPNPYQLAPFVAPAAQVAITPTTTPSTVTITTAPSAPSVGTVLLAAATGAAVVAGAWYYQTHARPAPARPASAARRTSASRRTSRR